MEQDIKEKLDRSASNKLECPTSEMPGKHQPSAFSTKIFVSKSIYLVYVSFEELLVPLFHYFLIVK